MSPAEGGPPEMFARVPRYRVAPKTGAHRQLLRDGSELDVTSSSASAMALFAWGLTFYSLLTDWPSWGE